VSDAITLTAPAKINLTLEVLRRREDGYHDIRSVMQRITLADTLTLEPASQFKLTCSDPLLEGPENLVWRAAELLRQRCAVQRGAALHLEKRIPVAAGLGGGSSDCAAALAGLTRLWDLGLDRNTLLALSAELGSDVPFFMVDSPTALAEGRGERLTSLPPLPERWVVLAKPDLGISAADVYRAFPTERWSDGGRTTTWLSKTQRGHLRGPFNDLEPVALAVAPAAATARQALLDAGAMTPVMAGSGSTYFALFERQTDAELVRDRLARAGWGQRSWLARFATL